jgi:uncharacterized protein YndB with AHSA1/START domain
MHSNSVFMGVHRACDKKEISMEKAQEKDRVAVASIFIDAPKPDVWEALVTPARIKEYMFGAEVESDWRVGSPIVWKGKWEGRPYEDKGEIRRFEPDRVLQYTHYSPLSGLPDLPENHHTVTVTLEESQLGTRVIIEQDHNPTEQAREHSEKNWMGMLRSLKKILE